MMFFNKTMLMFISALLPLTLMGQTRYIDSLFQPNLTQQNVIYGNAPALNWPYLVETYTASQDLLLDVYEPLGDSITDRPCLVVAHGGVFLLGSKTDAPVVGFCERMASKGYVVVSIDYRLGFNTNDSSSAIRATYRGIQDIKAAIRYVKHDAYSLGIDTSKVYAAGNSAGGIMAVHAAYLDESERLTYADISANPDLGCLSCSGNTYAMSDVPEAIANLWGAIIDTSLVGSNNNVPAISFHGDQDFIVSPNHARPFSLPSFPRLLGSTPLHQRLNHASVLNAYHVFSGQGHEPWGVFSGNAYTDSIVEATANFFYPMAALSMAEPSTVPILFQCYPNPASEKINILLSGSLMPRMWQVVNAEGEICLQGILQANRKFSLNIDGLSKGMYQIVLHCESAIYSRPFVKS